MVKTAFFSFNSNLTLKHPKCLTYKCIVITNTSTNELKRFNGQTNDEDRS